MGVLTSKPVQVSPLSLGFVEILRSHQRLGRGHCWRCWPRTQTRQPYGNFVEPQPHRTLATNRLLAVCLVTGNKPVAKCARPPLGGPPPFGWPAALLGLDST